MVAPIEFLVAKQKLYATLSPDERAFAERLLELDPNYRYDRSGLPKLDPVPAAGLASAVAAARLVPAWIRAVLTGDLRDEPQPDPVRRCPDTYVAS